MYGKGFTYRVVADAHGLPSCVAFKQGKSHGEVDQFLCGNARYRRLLAMAPAR